MFQHWLLEMINWSNTFWDNHDKLHASLETNGQFQNEMLARLEELSHELNTQMDTFDTNLTNLQVDTENEHHRIVRSHENLSLGFSIVQKIKNEFWLTKNRILNLKY